jgi:hypothetical protein
MLLSLPHLPMAICWQCQNEHFELFCPCCDAPKVRPVPQGEQTWNSNAEFLGVNDAEENFKAKKANGFIKASDILPKKYVRR